MTRHRCDIGSERGYALIYMTFILTLILLFSGLAVDTGRAYIVKAQLSKAVDGAALGAARNLNSGDPRGRGPAHLQGELSRRLPGDDLGDRPDHRSRVLQAGDDSGHRRQRRHRLREGDAAHDVHEPGELQGRDGEQFRRSHAENGGPQPRARRLQLDRRPMAGGPGCRTHVRPVLRRRQRPALAGHLRQRREGHRSDAVQPRLRQEPHHQRHPERAPRRQHRDGGGPVSWLGRIAVGAIGPAIRPPRDRALHRRRLEQRARHLRCLSHRSAKGLRTADFPKRSPDPDNQTHDNPSIDGLFDTQTGREPAPASYNFAPARSGAARRR